MKKLAACLALVLTLIASGTIYPSTMEVEKISGDTVLLSTSTGYIYEMHGAEDYEEGDLVSVIMFTNGTEKITDDVIVAARWSGYTRKGGGNGVNRFDLAKEEIYNALWELCEEDEETYQNACSGLGAEPIMEEVSSLAAKLDDMSQEFERSKRKNDMVRR